MPRVDNTDPELLRDLLTFFSGDMVAEIEKDVRSAKSALDDDPERDDMPGIIGPLDLCEQCSFELFVNFGHAADVPHPPYEDYDYECFLCGERLTNKDD